MLKAFFYHFHDLFACIILLWSSEVRILVAKFTFNARLLLFLFFLLLLLGLIETRFFESCNRMYFSR